MVNYTSCATTSESTGVSTVLELLIVGIDGKLLVSGSELLRVSVSTVTRQKILMSMISCPLAYV